MRTKNTLQKQIPTTHKLTKKKKKKTQERKKNLVNVRSPIMLHFVPLKLIPVTRPFLFFFCYWLNASEALHSKSLLQAHRCVTHPSFWGIFWQEDKNAKGNNAPKTAGAPPHAMTDTNPLCTSIKHSTEKHLLKRGSHAYTGTNKLLIAVEYLN